MMNRTPIRIFSASGCNSCETVKDALDTDNYAVLGVDGDVVIEQLSIEDPVAWARYKDVIDLRPGVPSAFHGVQQCKIYIDEASQKVTLDCRGEDSHEVESHEHEDQLPDDEPATVTVEEDEAEPEVY